MSVLSIVIARILQDDQRIVLLGCNHDLVLLGADTNELNVVLGVK